MDTKVAKPKEKRRNSERRKEKSRDAARCRRSRETEIFTDLAHALPLPASTVATLDKASVMRLVISYLQIRSLLKTIPKEVRNTTKSTSELDATFLKALEGFLIIVSSDGDIIFLSENVNEYLGLSQIELMGQSIYEVSHPCDHNEIKEILTAKDLKSLQRTFFLRMKCTITSKGKSVNLKSATYKVIHCTGHLVKSELSYENQEANLDEIEVEKQGNTQLCLVAIGEPIPHPANIEIPLGNHTFLSKHSLDMKFTYADDKMAEFLGYDPESLIGKSVFEFYHAQDSQGVGKAYKSLISKGQTQTGRYRFLAYGGGYVWILTQATLIYNNKGVKPQSVVCVHFITSGLEHKDEIYSSSQLQNVTVKKEVVKLVEPTIAEKTYPVQQAQSGEQVVRKVFPPAPISVSNNQKLNNKLFAGFLEPKRQTGPQAVTAKIFGRPAVSSGPRPQAVTAKLFKKPEPQSNSRTQEVTPNLTLPATESESQNSTKSKIPAKYLIPGLQSRPQAATSTIFVPRTEDMNKGFLMFSDEESGGLTLMKDEPEDLTHLAPTPGDVCIPLLQPSFNDMMDHFMLSENYSPLLSETSKEISPASSPYLSYRDEHSSGSLSPLSNSPGSLPPLLGEESPSIEDGTSMNTLLGLDLMDSLDSDDLSVKAPYISMSEVDDLPLMMTHDFMWGSYIPSPPSATTQDRKTCSSPSNVVDKPDHDSNLAKLLRTDYVKPSRSFSYHSPSNTFSNTKGEADYRKRPGPEQGGSVRTNCKRSKQSTNTIPRPGVLDGGGKPPNGGSVLMNLLVSGCDNTVIKVPMVKGAALPLSPSPLLVNKSSDSRIRLKSLSLLDPDCDIKLVDLTAQDYDVNAPAEALLQGTEILRALDLSM